jgi:hypothetical protein
LSPGKAVPSSETAWKVAASWSFGYFAARAAIAFSKATARARWSSVSASA